jgi:hypothetical protein
MPRPKANIDWKEAARLAQAGCKGTQIAAYFGCDDETLYNRCKADLNMGFSEFLHQNRSHGDALLLAKQFESALKDKDRGMLIWLGKQRLDQKDKKDVENKTEITGGSVKIIAEGEDPETNE